MGGNLQGRTFCRFEGRLVIFLSFFTLKFFFWDYLEELRARSKYQLFLPQDLTFAAFDSQPPTYGYQRHCIRRLPAIANVEDCRVFRKTDLRQDSASPAYRSPTKTNHTFPMQEKG